MTYVDDPVEDVIECSINFDALKVFFIQETKRAKL
jgi:hypothetical protein